MKIKPFRMKDLTPEKSKIVQEVLFKNGYKWCGSTLGQTISNLDGLHLYFNYDLAYDNSRDYFNNHSLPELIFEEFEKLYVNKEFVLPEKWCVKVTKKNVQECNEWRTFISKIHIGTFMHNNVPNYSDRGGSKNSILSGYTEITFEQFQKYVLGKKEIPEYVEEEWDLNQDFEITLTEPNDFKQASDVSDWLSVEQYTREVMARASGVPSVLLGNKSYIPMYTEPTLAQIVEEIVLIKQVNKVKPIKI